MEEIQNINELSLNELLTSAFDWARINDKKLYKNMDNGFDAFKCRQGLEINKKSVVIKDKSDVIRFLIEGLNKSDYHDTLKYTWTFINGGGNSDEDIYRLFANITPNPEDHPYLEIIPYIDQRMKDLKSKKLDTWHRSEDHVKHKHFRWWIRNILKREKSYAMRLFVENDTRCFDTFSIADIDSVGFKEILNYILDNNICPDIHHKSLIVPDFVNPDFYNLNSFI